MAKQTIILGTTANDGTGTTLRNGGDMINDNFTELYDQVTVGKKTYNSLITQSTTDDPTVILLEPNTIGIITYSRDDPGSYLVSSNALFTEDKTRIITGNINPAFFVSVSWNSSYELNIKCRDLTTGEFVDDALLNTPFLIEVYP